jgi:hypothetical protein
MIAVRHRETPILVVFPWPMPEPLSTLYPKYRPGPIRASKVAVRSQPNTTGDCVYPYLGWPNRCERGLSPAKELERS